MAETSHALDIVVPVYNEERTLEESVTRLCEYLHEFLPYTWTVTIADNASTDNTATIARRLAATIPGVTARILPRKGRGYALKTVWSESTAQVRAYIDVDLSTDLHALPALVAPLISGHSDLAIGTRLAPTSRIVRGAKRDIISRSYNLILRASLAVGYSDAQCGFKAITADVARVVLPHVTDTQWFFDTELLTIAEHAGLRIHEVPVDWVDDLDSRVDIPKTVREDLGGIIRLRRALRHGGIPLDDIYAQLGRTPLRVPGTSGEPTGNQQMPGQVVRFCIVGAASTIAYAVLYLALGLIAGQQTANFLALVLTAIANTAANRAFTFGVYGRARLAGHHIQGLAVFALAWFLTSSSLVLLDIVAPGSGRWAEILVLTAANLLATGIRFLVFRYVTFRGRVLRPSAARGETGTETETETETGTASGVGVAPLTTSITIGLDSTSGNQRQHHS